jgi:hypothetical protein
MDGKSTNEDDRRMARRVIWRLLALAALAHRTGAMALPLRFLLLWILRGAESRLRPIALRMARERNYRLVLPASLVSETGGTQAEAKRLALCYRALARALGDLLRGAYHAAMAWQAGRATTALIRRMAMALRPWPQLPGSERLCAGMAHDTS